MEPSPPSPSPPPSANPNEHQYWTDPILCDETRAKLEYYRSLGWLPPNHKPKTLEGIAVVERYWRKYCLQSNADYEKYLLSEDQAIYMNFFDWMHKTSREKRLQSYDEYWRRLKQYFSLFARRRMEPEVQEQMRRVYRIPPPCELAYCPILQIISYAFRDKAFANTTLTPELIWQLQVPDYRTSLPLYWKPEVLDTPLLRHVHSTEYGLELHQSLPMAYTSSREALRELGRDAKFEDDIGHYNYRRWTANEVNRHFTSQERQRVLGQSGDEVYQRHYQSHFFQGDLQNVVLLRPPQKHLLQAAGSMLRKRDLSAPSSVLTEEQRRAICQDPRILELRRAKREAMEEMRSLAGTKKKAQNLFPHLYEKHESLCKELSQLRKTLAKDTKETARK
ncbi:hypothetical protein F66182_12752, partial [Fusarium sp. NRRL 66182]